MTTIRRLNKLYFDCRDISRALGISAESSRVAASRFVKNGLIVRIKRNIYVLNERWENASLEEKFILPIYSRYLPIYLS